MKIKLLVLTSLLLTACGAGLKNKAIEDAQANCKDHGGLSTISRTIAPIAQNISTYTAVCVDGLEISRDAEATK